MNYTYNEGISYVNKVQEFIQRFKLELLSIEYTFVFVEGTNPTWEAHTSIGAYEFSSTGKTKANAKNKVAFLLHIFLSGIEIYHSHQTDIIHQLFTE